MGLVRRILSHTGDELKLVTVYDHSDILERNYEDRMSGERYIDKGHDFMKVCRIPVAFLASLTPEQRHELQVNPKALVRMLEKHPEFRTSTASL